MSEYRAPRTWHIEERFGRFYVVNQFGGFEGWHDSREGAVSAGKLYEKTHGDRFQDDDPQGSPDLLAALGAAVNAARNHRQERNG